ncbi:unnamed protein product [Moneuplotes crassus]|uniref:Uncharacterized protein n=1 Tax=Euplotes crassus TaxID=5936 RepID=A0AAD2D162_EUPCR|nr:unnamed protein product [Moneuplotes crassus]
MEAKLEDFEKKIFEEEQKQISEVHHTFIEDILDDEEVASTQFGNRYILTAESKYPTNISLPKDFGLMLFCRRRSKKVRYLRKLLECFRMGGIEQMHCSCENMGVIDKNFRFLRFALHNIPHSLKLFQIRDFFIKQKLLIKIFISCSHCKTIRFFKCTIDCQNPLTPTLFSSKAKFKSELEEISFLCCEGTSEDGRLGGVIGRFVKGLGRAGFGGKLKRVVLDKGGEVEEVEGVRVVYE